MINLLPPQQKKQINAGRINIILRRYCIVSLGLMSLLFVTIIGFYLIMISSKSAAQSSIDEGNAKLATYKSIQKNVDSFKNNLSTAKSILGNEIHYSKVITKIASTLPSNIVLQSLSLDSDSFGKPISISALGKTNEDALSLKTNLENSGLFQDVHLESITIDDQPKNGYPANISISVTLKPEVAKNEK